MEKKKASGSTNIISGALREQSSSFRRAVASVPSRCAGLQRRRHDFYFNLKHKGTIIQETEYRGITVRQLKELKNQISKRCRRERWTSTNPAENHNRRLLPNQVTLYDLVHYFIKPITSQRQCSYVEMVADGPQKPQWFVSHWWGEPVFDFIACIEQHAKDHFLEKSDDAVYWVCAYAMNQHNIEGEIYRGVQNDTNTHSNNPKSSPFYRAMQLTEGTVSILDEGAVCYQRIWCTFEMSIALIDFGKNRKHNKDEQYRYDVYTVRKGYGDDRDGLAVGLTDGPAEIDSFDSSRYLTIKYDGLKRRAARQSNFPLDLCRMATYIKVQHADASRPEDIRCILNCICANDDGDSGSLDDDPPFYHSAYNEINQVLRDKFESYVRNS